MEIFINDIPEDGLTLKLNSAKDAWFKDVLKDVLGESFTEDDIAYLDITFLRYDDDVDLNGDLILKTHPTCDRCLKQYVEELTIDMHSHMTPLYSNKRQREREINTGFEQELVKEDLEFCYYEGDRIYLDEVIKEQIVLALPMKHLCREDCLGLCQRCGHDLNEGPCSCKSESSDKRWDGLKNFKVSKS